MRKSFDTEQPEPEATGNVTNTPGPRKVAVLGVHGVGHHAAGETQNAMANLLLSISATNPQAAHQFKSFESVGIQLPLSPLAVPRKPAPRKVKHKLFNLYQEKSVEFSEELSEFREKRRVIGRGVTGNKYTEMLVENYEGGAHGDAYITHRLGGKRVSTDGSADTNVDIYEVLWSDLARPNNTILSFFLGLFQLVLHLGSLSRLAIETGSSENTGKLWTVFLAVQRYAVRILQIFLPLLMVILLVALLSYIPALDQFKSYASAIAISLCSLAAIGTDLVLINRAKVTVPAGHWRWAITSAFPAVVGSAIGALSCLWKPDIAASLACWIVLGCPLFYFILSRYNSVRKGMEITGWVTYVTCFVGFIICLWLTQGDVMNATFWMVESLAALIRIAWMLMSLCAFVALVAGTLLIWSVRKGDPARRARLCAAVRTSRFALALPSVLFLLITSLTWGALFQISGKLQESPFFPSNQIIQCPWFGWPVATKLISAVKLIPDINNLVYPSDYLRSLIVWTLGYQLPITLGLFSAGLFLLIWWALPAVFTEKLPLRNQQEPPRSSTNSQSVHLGTWISRGLDATSVVTFLFWCSIFLAPLIFYFVPDAKLPSGFKQLTEQTVYNPFVAFSGIALAALAKYGSPVLGVVLDVDNYLRTSPQNSTPRALIFERYVSTLRYLARYQDADGKGYDSVVIVAHSLGALISGDILRFLHEEGDPDLAALGLSGHKERGTISLKLLTMGNPTRQLLNRFFPYLYDWVRDAPDNGASPMPGPGAYPPTIASDPLPKAEDLGLEKWVNMYRSGDYVGRSLWLDEWYNRTDPGKGTGRYPERIAEAHSGRHKELCIGAGAHTHYWDDTAPDVAAVLNLLL